MSELSYQEKRTLLAQLLEKRNRTRKTAPLSFAQERLYFLNQLQPNSSFYNLPISFRLQAGLNVDALEKSLSEIVRRHEVLRTTFELADGSPVQVVHPAAPWKLQIHDASGSPDSEAEALRLAAAEAQAPFDLREGPLFRARLVRLHEQEHVLLLTMHHIVSDGWSVQLLVQELSALYESYSRGAAASLPELPIQYSDFALWQRRALSAEGVEKHLDYWREQLAGAPTILELPFDRPRPSVQSYRGDMQSFTIGRGAAGRLLRLGRQEGATLFMTLLAAFQVLLARYSGQLDVVVGTPIANRNRAELEGVIGFFVNTLVLRTRMEDDPTFVELLRRVKQTTIDAYAHQDLPFEKLVEELRPERELSHNPLFQVMFATDLRTDAVRPSPQAAGLSGKFAQANTGTVKFDLAFNMAESRAGLAGTVEYNTDLFDASTIRRLVGSWQVLLEAIADNPDERVSKLKLLTEQERRQLTSEWGGAASRPRPSEDDEAMTALLSALEDTFEGERIPVGRPAGGYSLYVLDAHLNPVPVGVAGELFVGGERLARGYLNRAVLTATRFLPDPYSRRVGARMYRTGDLARHLQGGGIELLGGVDDHAKLRGMRLDLREVEAALREFPGVQDAVAATYQVGPGDVRLVAYLVAEVRSRPSQKALRRYLRGRLPAHMMPSVLAWLDRLPKDSSGNLDRNALPPFPDAEAEPELVAPASALEQVMAGIWAELIGVEPVGGDDSFFELGGHSLLATQLCSRILDIFDIMVPMQQLFEEPRLVDFCSAVLNQSSDPLRTEKIAELMLAVAAVPDEELPAASQGDASDGTTR